MDPATFLFDVPPLVVERFCSIMDSGDDRFGWRGLAVRVVPSLLEVRKFERVESSGRSPTRELLWSWAQQNPRVQDLLGVLQQMGHHRALQLFQGEMVKEPPLHLSSQHADTEGQTLAVKDKESIQLEESSSSQISSSSSNRLCFPVNIAGDDTAPEITFQAIIEGTRDFHQEVRISEGHFCDVYRAPMGNKTFAVKLFKQINNGSWRTLWDVFTKEMEIHKLYQHPNILDLLGCFSDGGRYCLVYPYLPKGSLFNRLHHQGDWPPLTWQERLTIIKGIAKALHHLHTTQPCAVICGNISSCNVLLDDALQPKLSDFGLARLRPQHIDQHCTITMHTSSHSNLGYLPGEYMRHRKLSFSLDVYSFGMVTMETVTGRKVIGDGPKPVELRDLLASEVEDGGDVTSCLQFVDPAAGQWPSDVVLGLLSLAMGCTASVQRSRPNMETVLLKLSQLLPPPSRPFLDHPRSLDDLSLVSQPRSLSSCVPAEHSERRSLPASLSRAGPCECSQSEATYLSEATKAGGEEALDLYCSWPVQCSCQAETGSLTCEDCRANGYSS